MKRNYLLAMLAMVVVASFEATGAKAENAYDLAWARQLGTSGWEQSWSVAVDPSGNAYLSGWTSGDLGGPQAGVTDAFLAKYNASGDLLWTRQLGTGEDDFGYAVAVDGSGNAYLSGNTWGSLGGPNAGSYDLFLAKYDTTGNLLWTRQLGTLSGDYSHSVAVDGLGNVFLGGYTWGSLGGPNAGVEDAFLAKYDAASGTLLWTRQIGMSNNDYGYSVAADGLGNVYLSGSTYGSLGGPNAGVDDAFLAKYDASGSLLWIRQLGTSAGDQGYAVAVDGDGNAYLSGGTYGSLGGSRTGDRDAFLAKYDASGTLLWTRQLGTSETVVSFSVAVDESEKIYISGYASGDLGGPIEGGEGAFLAKYDDSGTLLWACQLGTSENDVSRSVAVNGSETVYISGTTWGSLGGPNAGQDDAFLAKYIVPEPSALAMLALGAFGIFARLRSRG